MKFSFSAPRPRRVFKPLLAAATLTLLAGCANGFDPVKIVLAPVTELLNQLDNVTQVNNTEQTQDQGQEDQQGAPQTAKTATAKAPAPSDSNRPVTWRGLSVGEMTVAGKTLLVARSRQGTHEYEVALKRYRSLGQNEGVLYIYPNKREICLSTRDLPALSMAYLDDDGTIINIADIPADSTSAGCSVWAVNRALIMPSQWFSKNDIIAGDKVSDFKPVTAARQAQIMAEPQVMQAVARGAGGNLEALLQVGKAYNHRYLCEKEEAQGLLYVQSRGADGSVNAVYDLAVADIEKNTVAGVRVQMKGVKNAQGDYDFTPVSTLKSSPKYKVNRIRAFGNLTRLSVNLSGSACATPEQMPLWSKVPDSFASVNMPLSVNLAVRALHRADFYYKAERVGTRLPNGARANKRMQEEGRAREDLGIRLVAAGRALPGEAATTGHLFRVDAATAIEAGRSQRDDRSKRQYIKTAGEYALSQSCSEPRSAYQCLHQHVVVHNDYVLGQKLQPKTGAWQNYRKGLDSSNYSTMRSATELELFNSQVKAAQSEKVRWTPLDFAPHYEIANYEILPGQPSADDSLVKLNYRYARYVYLYSRVMMQEKGEAFLKNYTVKMTGEEAKERPMSSNETNVPFLGGAVGRSICSDRTFTVSITPKTAAARRDRALDVDWIMLAERLENGRPSVERRIHASHYALNAKNGYSARQTITFPCVTKSSKSETKVWWFTETETIELKNLKLGVDIVRVYE